MRIKVLVAIGLWGAMGVLGCGGSDPEPLINGPLSVWPGSIYLGLTGDGQKFSAPAGASGGTGLEWTGEKATPRFTVSGSDTGATVTAAIAGADTLHVRSSMGEEVKIEVLVTAYPAGVVGRGRTASEKYGCQKAGCHDTSGPDFTPSRIAGFSDADLQAWIIQGKSLKTGQTISTHVWDLTITEEQDVVGYLRSLAPRGAPVKQ